MKIQTKIYNVGRKWLLHIPSIVMKGLNWGGEVIEIEINPEENLLKIYAPYISTGNKTTFLNNINIAKYEKNKKKFQKIINKNLSEEGRKALYDTNWDKVTDGGYIDVQNLLNYSNFFEKRSKESKDKELSNIEKNLSKNFKNYAKRQFNLLEKKNLKKPPWFKFKF